MLNRVTIQGRVTAAPELRRAGETPVASFTLAVDRDYTDKDGNRGCDFIPCVAWRGTGEFVSRNFGKGQQAIVSGRLQQRNYTDKDGNKRTAYEVIADGVYFCGSKQTADTTPEYAELDETDADLPF